MLVEQTPKGNPARAADAGAAVEPDVRTLLERIRENDAEGIAAALDRLGERHGTAAAAMVVPALETSGLTGAMLAAMSRRAEALRTPLAWTQLAAAAAAVGRDELAAESAGAALRSDPATPGAAFILAVAANRRGDHDAALRAISDLAARLPAAKDDPNFLFQAALAELGRNQPQAALAAIEPALPGLAAIGVGFEAQALRARALSGIPERAEEAVGAWQTALAAATQPAQADQARDGLIAALLRAGRHDESLRQLDLALAATTSAQARANFLDARPTLLAAKGDFDGALAAIDDLAGAAADASRRVLLRLRQARIAASARRWKEAAARFDAASAGIDAAAADAAAQRRAIQSEKAQSLASRDIDLVLADLDELDASWSDPGWPMPIDLRVGGLLAANRAAEALGWLEQRLAGAPGLAGHPAAHHLRAEIELKLDHTDEAMRGYARAVELAPAATDARSLLAVLVGANATQQWSAAASAYERLARLEPASAADPALRVIAASAYLRLGDLETALKLTEGAQPEAANMLALRDVTRAEAQVRQRRFDDALATTAGALARCAAAPSDVPAELVLSLHALRAQALNERGEFEAARAAASAAIDLPDRPGSALKGLPSFIRLGVYMQRSLAEYRLGRLAEAQRDIDAAIAGFDRVRDSAALKLIARSPDFERFETTLWFAKGAALDAEGRTEEALAGYSRAERLEKHGSVAANARGYALSRTGAFPEAIAAFESALARAESPRERADALAGKGRALVRLKRFEEAIGQLQAALDARLMEPDDDAGVFEMLGIAYTGLQRNGAALGAFRRAWTLTAQDKRSVNLARGVAAAALRLDDPAAALKFLDELPEELRSDRTLLFNRALALDALGRRREAIRCLVRAKDAGLDRAQEELDRLDAPAGLARWTTYWFGAQASLARRVSGFALAVLAATGLGAPLLQWWASHKLDWYLLLLPSVVALVLLALPNMKSITIEAGKLKLSAEPLPATGREAAPVAAPESFNVPMLGTVAVTATETNQGAKV